MNLPKARAARRPAWRGALVWLGLLLATSCTFRKVNLPVVCDGAAVDLPPGLDPDRASGGAPTVPSGAGGMPGTHDASVSSDGTPALDAEPDPSTNKLPLGAACAEGGDCTSGFCVDGLCCDNACTGDCEACDGASKGTCAPVTGAPRGEREACLGAGTPCAGTCDGRLTDRCRYPGGETECAPATCADGMATARSVCSGAGVCVPGASVSCSPFSCDGRICAGGCDANRPCETGKFCSGGRCFDRRANGASCEADDQCASDKCVDGRCCARASCGSCEACTGANGTCVAVNGADPDSCAGQRRCTDGSCRANNGQACKKAADCVSGNCVAGRCCNSACTGDCQSCALPGSIGTCKSIATGNDVNNCGGCGTVCSRNHMVPTCNNGMCGGTCREGWANCNGDLRDGCETHVMNDERNCGACGKVCILRCMQGNCRLL